MDQDRSDIAIVRQRLPFPAVAVLSRNDPFADVERMGDVAARWGARLVDAGERGHPRHRIIAAQARELLDHLRRPVGRANFD